MPDPGSQDGSQDDDEDVVVGDLHGPAPGGGGVRNENVLFVGGVFSTTVCSWSSTESLSADDPSTAVSNPPSDSDSLGFGSSLLLESGELGLSSLSPSEPLSLSSLWCGIGFCACPICCGRLVGN